MKNYMRKMVEMIDDDENEHAEWKIMKVIVMMNDEK